MQEIIERFTPTIPAGRGSMNYWLIPSVKTVRGGRWNPLKISAEEIQDMIDMRKNGSTLGIISNKYKISKYSVWKFTNAKLNS